MADQSKTALNQLPPGVSTDLLRGLFDVFYREGKGVYAKVSVTAAGPAILITRDIDRILPYFNLIADVTNGGTLYVSEGAPMSTGSPQPGVPLVPGGSLPYHWKNPSRLYVQADNVNPGVLWMVG